MPPQFQSLALSAPKGGEVAAVCATDVSGVFVAYLRGVGFRYLDLSARTCTWSDAGKHKGSLLSPFGIHFHRVAGDGAGGAHVCFLEEARSLACVCIPDARTAAEADGGSSSVALIARTALPADVIAVASDADYVATALSGGIVRFYEASTGKAAGKGLKVEALYPASKTSLVSLGPGRVVLLRGSAGVGVEFYKIAIDAETRKCVLELNGVISGTVPASWASGPGQFLGAARSSVQDDLDRLMICWEPAKSAKADSASSSFLYASVALESDSPRVEPLQLSAPGRRPATPLWSCVRGHLFELFLSAQGQSSNAMQFSLRDERFGMHVATGSVPFAAACEDAIVATAGDATVVIGRGGVCAAVLWALPNFALCRAIGTGATQATDSCKTLTPLREVLRGKRARDDKSVEELFTSKRRAVTDKTLADEVKARRWKASGDLVDSIIEHKCWASACALLALPELDEGLAVRLLAARPDLLSRVVRRARAPQLLDTAVRDHLPAALLPRIIEVLLQWMEAHRRYPEAVLRKAAPGMPGLAEIMAFLGSVVDGCLPSLARVDANLIELVFDALKIAHADVSRTEHLYGSLRAALRAQKPSRAASAVPTVEVMLLPL